MNILRCEVEEIQEQRAKGPFICVNLTFESQCSGRRGQL